ncbi:MAG: hypothetical protein NC412_01675 [Roseburia sp.]|nr:hypothetical protein [Roseburia sp.]MCM1277966.1 hypothetical protein [Robinsoniella sp.]
MGAKGFSDKTKKNKGDRYKVVLIVILMVLSLAAAISKIWIGFDVDEGYAVSMPYRLLQGDRLLLDMWEIHQTSSFLPYLFLAPFVKITGGSTGIILYLRIVSTVIHLCFSLWLYKVLSGKMDWEWSCLCGLFYFNFLPKWLMNLDFSMQLIWGMTAMLLFLLHGEKEKSFSPFFAGVSLAFTVLGYPTMVILYPAALWLIMKYNKKSMKKIGMFTLGCGVCAIAFFAYLLQDMSGKEIISNIPHIFSDGSHQFDMMSKWALFFGRWLEAVLQAAVLIIPCGMFVLLCRILIPKCFPGIKWLVSFVKEHLYCFFVLVFLLVSSLIVIFADLVGIPWGPFRLQVRYLVLFLLAFLLGKKNPSYWMAEKRRQLRKIRDYLLLVAFIAFAGILLASNVGPVSSSSYLVLGILALVPLLYSYGKEAGSKQMERVMYVAVGVFVLSLIFCKGYYVRVSEYPPANILEQREQVSFGPLKGIYIYPEDLERAEDFHKVVQEGEREEKLLLLSTEGIYNLSCRGTYVTPTTISTPAFNEQWVEYFTIHKEHMPDRIIIGRNTVDDLDKFFSLNPFGIWIGENYDITNRKEDEYLCVIQSRQDGKETSEK